MKQEITIESYGKINLTLDVQGLLDNGYHKVEMVMQQIDLHDTVHVTWQPSPETGSVSEHSTGTATDDVPPIKIDLSTSRSDLPVDMGNLAYRAADLMCRKYGTLDRTAPNTNHPNRSGLIKIHIEKRLPVAAGLAGGSSNCASVLHALNALWDLNLSVAQLCELGSELGSDIPFCIMGQAAASGALRETFHQDPLACHCALATGTGTSLQPLTGLKSDLVLSKPSISVSTAEVYRGIDHEEIPQRPNTSNMIHALIDENVKLVRKNMINVLENFSLKRYPVIVYTKNKMQTMCESDGVLMSGSGPTVFGLCDSMQQAKDVCREMLKENSESYWTRTTF